MAHAMVVRKWTKTVAAVVGQAKFVTRTPLKLMRPMIVVTTVPTDLQWRRRQPPARSFYSDGHTVPVVGVPAPRGLLE